MTGSTNRLAGATYDASGNLLQLNATSTLHTFDVLDEMRARLDGSTTWQYLYTVDGERVIERNPATGLMRWTLRGPGNQPLRLLEDRGQGTWTLLRDYIYAGNRLVASVGTEGPRHYHLDHLGSVRLETNDAGAMVKQRNFLPFGEELSTAGVSENEMRFTGHERDDVAAGTSVDDLDYMHARFGSPTMGRFLSLDPVLGRVGVPQGWNRYAYVRNRPMIAIDPAGRALVGIAGIAFNTYRQALSSSNSFGERYLQIFGLGRETRAILSQAADLLDPLTPGAQYQVLAEQAAQNDDPGMNFAYNSIADFLPDSVLGVVVAVLPGGSLKPASVVNVVNTKIYAQLEKQLARDGSSSILKALRSAEKSLERHRARLPGLEFKSQVEGTVKNVESQIATLRKFIQDKGLQ